VDNLHGQTGSGNVVHLPEELFKGRSDAYTRLSFDDMNLYKSPAEIPRYEAGGRRSQICWFGEVSLALDRIYPRWSDS
jgi:NAD-dependent SIR2 family protein deacetylase